LKKKIEAFFLDAQVRMKVLVPFHDGRVVTALHDLNAIRLTEYTPEGTLMEVQIPSSRKDEFMKYRIEEQDV
ncbi:MAG: GTPase HflX, partial [Selenomonadaceae bacterium]|nr:GTPase HflX [Selenomonadaceae bacterium]